jgi:hypothetical protein
MTKQMQSLMSRVDGVTADIPPISILEPPTTGGADSKPSSARRRAEDRRRRLREARTKAGVVSARVPRAIEALALADPGEMHGELVVAGLL